MPFSEEDMQISNFALEGQLDVTSCQIEISLLVLRSYEFILH